MTGTATRRTSRLGAGAGPGLAALVVTWATVVPGCFFGGDDPCDRDRYDCSNASESELEAVASCQANGPLVVEAGHGEHGFQALAAGDTIPIETGSQGGQHLFAGLRVLNADLESYDKLFVSIEAHMTGGQQELIGARSLVLGDRDPIPTLADGAVQVSGLLVFMGGPWPPDAGWRITYAVRDPCGREGVAVHAVPGADSAGTVSCAGEAPTCGDCDSDVSLQATCVDGAWVCESGRPDRDCTPADHPSCSDYGGEVCCGADGAVTDAYCPSPSQPMCEDGSTPQSSCD